MISWNQVCFYIIIFLFAVYSRQPTSNTIPTLPYDKNEQDGSPALLYDKEEQDGSPALLYDKEEKDGSPALLYDKEEQDGSPALLYDKEEKDGSPALLSPDIEKRIKSLEQSFEKVKNTSAIQKRLTFVKKREQITEANRKLLEERLDRKRLLREAEVAKRTASEKDRWARLEFQYIYLHDASSLRHCPILPDTLKGSGKWKWTTFLCVSVMLK